MKYKKTLQEQLFELPLTDSEMQSLKKINVNKQDSINRADEQYSKALMDAIYQHTVSLSDLLNHVQERLKGE